MTLYTFENLSAPPHQGYLKFLVSKSSVLTGNEWTDISYHSDEKWLKVWFNDSLSSEEESELSSLVTAAQGTSEFMSQEGEAYSQFYGGSKRWETYKRTVTFPTAFFSVPEIEIYDAEFLGLANLQVVKVTERGFNFLIDSDGAHRNTDTLVEYAFNWRAWTL